MPNIAIVGLEPTAARHLSRVLAGDSHPVRHYPHNVPLDDLLDADMVFAGGEPSSYLSLLRRVRATLPALPFVVVTRLPETKEWLDALEAGATDYCSVPISIRQLRWLLETVVPRHSYAARA